MKKLKQKYFSYAVSLCEFVNNNNIEVVQIVVKDNFYWLFYRE